MLVPGRGLPTVHGDTLCRVITKDNDQAVILMLTDANVATERVADGKPDGRQLDL